VRIVTAAALHRVALLIVESAGSRHSEARAVANQLIDSNLAGHDSHGVGLLPTYVRAVLNRNLLPNQMPTVTSDNGPLLQIDGRGGYGQVVASFGLDQAIRRARVLGVALVGMKNLYHLGRVGYWAERCARNGMISVHFVSVRGRPIVAPWGAREARLGTNPFCIGIPRGQSCPVVIDFATSAVAQGKLRLAYYRGLSAPPGALLDDQGFPTLDPSYAVAEPWGAILPFGQHKGYALAVGCQLLATVLLGTPAMEASRDADRIVNGILSVVIDPSKLTDLVQFRRRLDDFATYLHRSQPLFESAGVKLPGEPEAEARRVRGADGIEVDDNSWESLVSAAQLVEVSRGQLEQLLTAGDTANRMRRSRVHQEWIASPCFEPLR
jgi:hydroxycarboxylate dehydrogenase B